VSEEYVRRKGYRASSKKKERVYEYKLSKKIIEKLLRDFITINKAYS
jgi:hypothetical protein